MRGRQKNGIYYAIRNNKDKLMAYLKVDSDTNNLK